MCYILAGDTRNARRWFTKKVFEYADGMFLPGLLEEVSNKKRKRPASAIVVTRLSQSDILYQSGRSVPKTSPSGKTRATKHNTHCVP